MREEPIYWLSDNKLLGSNNLLIIEPIFRILLDNKIQSTVCPYCGTILGRCTSNKSNIEPKFVFVGLVHLCKIKEMQAYLHYFLLFCHRKRIMYRKRRKTGILECWYRFFNFCITNLILVSKGTAYEFLLINSEHNLIFKIYIEQNEKKLVEILCLRLQNSSATFMLLVWKEMQIRFAMKKFKGLFYFQYNFWTKWTRP